MQWNCFGHFSRQSSSADSADKRLLVAFRLAAVAFRLAASAASLVFAPVSVPLSLPLLLPLSVQLLLLLLVPVLMPLSVLLPRVVSIVDAAEPRPASMKASNFQRSFGAANAERSAEAGADDVGWTGIPGAAGGEAARVGVLSEGKGVWTKVVSCPG